jgi:FAD/FMN-containing dehydrogenase
MADLSGLSIAGRVATPSDSDWDEVRRGQNLRIDMHPQGIAFVENVDDVAAVVGFAAENDLKVTGQGTGHGSPALPPLDGTILIRTGQLRGVEVDGESRTATVEAGVRSPELGAAAVEADLCFLPGSSPTVGVTGYTLGGGMGWLGRKFGFACNHVRSIDLVTADGEARRVDADNEPDLFWALRGGGGGYGIVTALQLELVPVTEVYAGLLVFPAELGGDAIKAYRDWTDDVPEEVTSDVRFLRPPPLPTVPEPIRGKALLVFGACIIGGEEGEKLVAPLRELGEPILDTMTAVSPETLSTIAMDPEDPVPSFGHHGVLREFPDEAIDALVEVAGADSGTPLLLANVRQCGGALGRAPEGAGALDKLDAAWTVNGIGVPMAPDSGPPIEEGLDQLIDSMAPWAGEGGYFNFADRPCGVDAILPADTCKRLAEVKRKWDPDDRIVANHAVALTTA